METLDVATRAKHTLKANYSTKGLKLNYRYASKRDFPGLPLTMSWVEWERFVAWVELKRKEDALQELKA